MPIPSFSDIIKILNTAINQAAATEVQAFIFDLQNKLQELKEQNLELKTDLQEKSHQYQSQIMELQRTIDRQQKEIDGASNWEKTKSEYSFDDRLGVWIHKSTNKPFCPICFDRKAETPLRISSGGFHSYWCFPCNHGF